MSDIEVIKSCPDCPPGKGFMGWEHRRFCGEIPGATYFDGTDSGDSNHKCDDHEGISMLELDRVERANVPELNAAYQWRSKWIREE